jgi:hypothetical protein
MGEGNGFFTAASAFDALAAAHQDFAGMSYDTLGVKGAVVASARGQMAGAGA